MLMKRIDLGSIPYGLAVAGEDIVKGSAVVVKRVGGVLKAFLPTTQAEADAVKGFATFRIEEAGGSDVSHDTIKAGKYVVIYTTVKDNQWGTTQFVGTLAEGDNLVVDFDADKGKIRKISGAEVTASRRVFATCEAVYNAGSVPAIDLEIK